jgi:hypothetical protein
MTTLNETMSENEIKNGSAVLHRYENTSTNYIMCVIRKLNCSSHNGPIGEEVDYCDDHNNGSGCKDRVGKDNAMKKRKVNVICADCEIVRLRAELDEARSSTRTSASSTRTSSSSTSSKKSAWSVSSNNSWCEHEISSKQRAARRGMKSSQYKAARFMGLIR